MKPVLVLIFSLVLTSGSLISAHAGTYSVTKTADTADGICNADCSLREAVIAANNQPGADHIFLPAGVYVLTRSDPNNPNEQLSLTGDLDILESLSIVGAGAKDTVIDGGAGTVVSPDRVFDIGVPESFSLSHLTIRNGESQMGGGIKVRVPSTLLNIDGVVIRDNTAELVGGGVAVVAGKQAGAHTSLIIQNSALINNTAQQMGGAIWSNQGGDSSIIEINLTNVTMSQNKSVDPQYAGASVIQAVTSSSGAGKYSFKNVTIADNAGFGPGPMQDQAVHIGTTVGNPVAASVEFTNSIVQSCFAFINTNATVSSSHSIDKGNFCGFDPAFGNLVNTDPLLDLLQDNGGSTPTHALLPGSPAIDAGGNADCPLTDQRGAPRPVGAGCDIGAFELGGVPPKFPVCGNKKVESGEQCDDGNTANGDGCSDKCQFQKLDIYLEDRKWPQLRFPPPVMKPSERQTAPVR